MALRHSFLIDQIAFVTLDVCHDQIDVFGPYGGNGGSPSITFGHLIRSFYGRQLHVEGHGIDQNS